MDPEADRTTTRFKNFPIREFVASVREKDPEKCWPFASLCAYKNFDESISLVNLNIFEDAEAPELSEGEIFEGKEAGTDTPTGFEHEILEGNETGSDTATGSELEKGKETATAKAIELQISKGKNTGFETAAGNTSNVNSKSIINTEDNSDDDTLGSFLKKRKGVEITRGARNEKKQKRHQPDTLRSAGAPGSECGVVLTGSGAGGSKGPGMGAAGPAACDGRYLKITVNRNPADFSAPEAGNRFMRK